MKRLAIVAVLALAGCADSHATIRHELPKYFGRPITDLQAKLGMPTSEETIMGRKAYIWFTRRESTCNIRVFVDAASIVQTVEMEGGEIACRGFAAELAS